MKQITLKAYAKINIGLNIVNKRSDGYHEIETIFQQIDLYDRIKITAIESDDIKIRTNRKDLPIDRENSCYRAAELVRDEFEINKGVKIELIKTIPIGAGLGGGSSDAAEVLKGMLNLWGIKTSKERLVKIATKIGADVPFFLEGGTALGFGIGDKLQPFRFPYDYYLILVYPNIKISTEWAYKNFNFNLTKTKKIIKLSQIYVYNYQLSELRKIIHNDLEEVVFKKYKELQNIKNQMYENGAFLANMSGSGSTIYGMFSGHKEAEKMMNRFPSSYQVYLTQPMI